MTAGTRPWPGWKPNSPTGGPPWPTWTTTTRYPARTASGRWPSSSTSSPTALEDPDPRWSSADRTTTIPAGGGYDHPHPAPGLLRLLGVPADATTAQIKKAYRKLARQHHPDTNPGDTDAADRFQAITEAYDTLTDPARRQAYDATRPPASLPPPTHHTRPRTARPSAPSSRCWKTSGWRSAAGTREIPAVVIIIASGTDRKQPGWGHHAPGRWNAAHEQRAEIMISGEGLRRTPAEVLGTLLHEAAHALAHARGIKDTSRQGRYHNKQFKIHAEELGLTVEHDPASAGPAPRSPTTPPTPTPASSPPCPTP